MSFDALLKAASPSSLTANINGVDVLYRGLTGMEADRHQIALLNLANSGLDEIIGDDDDDRTFDMDEELPEAVASSHEEKLKVIARVHTELFTLRREVMCDCIMAINGEEVDLSPEQKAKFVTSVTADFQRSLWALIETASGMNDEALDDATKN